MNKKEQLFDIQNTPLRRFLQINASAGTGKTYSIERLVIRLILEADLDIESILVVTFTNKAANEIKERVRILLHTIIHEQVFLDKKLSPDELAKLHGALSRYDQAAIFTIHGFCQNLLNLFPFESNCPFTKEVVQDKTYVEETTRDFFRRYSNDLPDSYEYFCRKLGYPDFDTIITELTKLIGKDPEGYNISIFPDARLVQWVGDMHREFEDKQGSLANAISRLQSFPRAAGLVDGILQKAYTRLKETGRSKIISTAEAINGIESFFDIDRVFTDKSAFVEFSKCSPEYLENTSKVPLDEVLDETEYAYTQAAGRFIEALGPLLDTDNKSIISTVYFTEFINYFLKAISPLVSQQREITGSYTFDDLVDIVYTQTALNQNKELIQAERRKYAAALIDEFQDTDHKQWAIFNALYGPAGEDRESYLFLIGDPKQSIYRFRKADLSVYYKAVERIPPQNHYTLGYNYRSDRHLIEGMNIVFSRLFKNDKNTVFTPVKAGNENAPVIVHKGEPHPAVEFLHVRNTGGQQSSKWTVGKARKAAFDCMALKTKLLLDRGFRLAEGNDERDIRPDDIAILCGTNAECARLQASLLGLNIPSVVSQRQNIFETDEANDILLILKALARPSSLSAVKASLLGTIIGLDPSELLLLDNSQNMDDVIGDFKKWGSMTDQGNIIGAFAQITKAGNRYRSLISDGHGCLSHDYYTECLQKQNGERSITNTRHILEILQEVQKKEGTGCTGLSALMRNENFYTGIEEETGQRLDRDTSAVNILTMHASKGLEFPVVIIAGCINKYSTPDEFEYTEEGSRILSYIKTREAEHGAAREEWQEKRRLFYVAFTRAKSKLILPAIEDLESCYWSSMWAEIAEENPDQNDTPRHIKIPNSAAAAGKLWQKVSQFTESAAKESPHVFMNDTTTTAEILSPAGTWEAGEPPENKDLEAAGPVDFSDMQKRLVYIQSYTSLFSNKTSFHTHFSERGEADYGENAPETQLVSPEGPVTSFSIEGGASLGNLLHGIIEEIDFSQTAELDTEEFMKDADIEKLCLDKASRYFPLAWYNTNKHAVKQMVHNTLQAAVPLVDSKSTFRFCDLDKENRLHELEFYIHCAGVPAGSNRPETGTRQATDYIKGYIDLMFSHEGKYYIADWKSNFLGRDISSYNEDRLTEAMEDHNYTKQYLLYTAAVCKILKKIHGVHFSYEKDFGGIYYIFSRAAGQGSDHEGVFGRKPARGIVRSFARQYTGMGEYDDYI